MHHAYWKGVPMENRNCDGPAGTAEIHAMPTRLRDRGQAGRELSTLPAAGTAARPDARPDPLSRSILVQIMNLLPKRAVLCSRRLTRIYYANNSAVQWLLPALTGACRFERARLILLDRRLRQVTAEDPSLLPMRFVGTIAKRLTVIEMHALNDDSGDPSLRLLLW
jgi:hypothetical protein